jgi:Family of unknown function (DUF5691)
MESWNHIVQAATMGIERKQIKKEELVPEIAASIDEQMPVPSQEDAFLQLAALTHNYRQCGSLPFGGREASIISADEEEKKYAGSEAHRVLQEVLESESNSLFRYWLELCAAAEWIVQPEWIPLFLDKGQRNKELRGLVRSCCGKRGAWLSQFNEVWKYNDSDDPQVLWETGTLEQRRIVLGNIRKVEPARARQLLQEIWNQENAATRTELLQQFSIGLSDEDRPWLEELLADKSIKVRDAAMELLKRIPASSIVQFYWQVLSPAIELKKERGLLGLSSKQSILIHAINNIPEPVYKSGIEKLSSEKNVSDQDFLVYQLSMSVPPSFWSDHLQLEKMQLLKLLQQHAKKLLSALAQAAARFEEKEWLRAILELEPTLVIGEALAIFPQKEAEVLALRYLQSGTELNTILSRLVDFKNEWSRELAMALLEEMSKSPYQYSRAFFNDIVYLLPPSVAEQLDRIEVKEEYVKTVWNNNREHIKKILSLKQLTKLSFTP